MPSTVMKSSGPIIFKSGSWGIIEPDLVDDDVGVEYKAQPLTGGDIVVRAGITNIRTTSRVHLVDVCGIDVSTNTQPRVTPVQVRIRVLTVFGPGNVQVKSGARNR